jgi:hypothetical protein
VKVIPAGPTKRPKEEVPVDPATVPIRKTPAAIILKLDDLKLFRNSVHPRWQRVADYLDSRKVKGTMGVICQTLEQATPEYAAWIKDHRATGRWEFWFHGWDHGVHEEEGAKYNEFVHRSYAEQRKRIDDSQKLAMEKLGFAFATFGPPGGVGSGSFDENTIRVMGDEPHIKAWLYPQPIDAKGKALEAEGKVVILDRVWDVNLEAAVGSPSFSRFAAGYAKHLDRPYFVLQGHPGQWNDIGFAEFEKIIDFLVERHDVFVLPAEYAATIGKQASAAE